MVPYDTESPFVTSGMRVGTAAITTRGMLESYHKMLELILQEIFQLYFQSLGRMILYNLLSQ